MPSNRTSKQGYLDALLNDEEPNQWKDGTLIRCKRCGVDYKHNHHWKKLAFCPDCREALDELEGKHEWHSEMWQKRVTAKPKRLNRYNKPVDNPLACCQNVVNKNHDDCKGGLHG